MKTYRMILSHEGVNTTLREAHGKREATEIAYQALRPYGTPRRVDNPPGGTDYLWGARGCKATAVHAEPI